MVNSLIVHGVTPNMWCGDAEMKFVRCPRCESILEVDEEGLAREMEWWKLLDWSQMKNTFDKLPPEIRNKIRIYTEKRDENK